MIREIWGLQTRIDHEEVVQTTAVSKSLPMFNAELKARQAKLEREQKERTQRERLRVEKERLAQERQRQRQAAREEEQRQRVLSEIAAAEAVRNRC